MWACYNDAFLSYVHKDCKENEVLVRSRRPGDIEKVHPTAKVTEYDRSDYQFRAVISREEFEASLVREARRVVYSNFKNSVRGHDLHHAYSQVWSVMAKLQPKPPYSGFNRGRKQDTFFADFGAEELDKRSPARGKKVTPKKLTKGQ